MENMVLVDGQVVSEEKIHAENSVVEIKENHGNLTVLFPKKLIVWSNNGNLSVYGEHTKIEIKSNDCNLQVFGDYMNAKIANNNSNLHLFGDYGKISVLDNDCNLYILGLHNDVSLQKGSATIYGDYGHVNVYEGAQAETAGKYKTIQKIG